jgi:taurine transport system ATP-binding protein
MGNGSVDGLETGTPAVSRPRKVISVDGISVVYTTDSNESLHVLRDVFLDLYEGEFVCLLGPSGCGKSTLLKIVAGLLRPSAGLATLDGKPITGPDWQRGVVFQHPPLYPWMTVEQNVSFGPRMRGLPKAQVREETARYLEKVHLGGFSGHKIYELSGGMRQRVAIARALINNPRILLMDEPFGALDALTREQMQTLVRGLWAETHKTILFITHDVDEALSLGTRVLVMTKDSGKIDREIEVDFTRRFSNDAEEISFSQDFRHARRQILSIIRGRFGNCGTKGGE